MNIRELHTQEKPVSAVSVFKSELGNAIALRIMKGEVLKEHVTKTAALLICMDGKAVFENEKSSRITLLPGDYVHIEPMVKHWVTGELDSHLVLVK